MPNIWYKNKETDTIWWKDDPTVIGVWIFSFDKTTEFNMFHDYPYKLTKELPQAQNIIFGKPSKAKEKKMKIKDIDANSGRITLEGRIVNSECRETKTGKGMLIYEIYDGTGIITCKSFAKDLKEGQEITEKIKNANAIK